MADMLKDGLAWLLAQQQAHVSQPIVYRRGNASVALTAVLGLADSALTAEFGGGQLRTQDKAFVIDAAVLILDGETATPLPGDTIDLAEGGATNRYRVAPPRPNEPWFSWDAYRLAFTVETKLQKAIA